MDILYATQAKASLNARVSDRTYCGCPGNSLEVA